MAEIQRGEFRKGYYYKGGDPKDKANWVKPPSVGEVRNGYSYAGGAPFEKSSWKPVEMGEPKQAGIPGEAQARGFLTGVSDSATLGYLPQIAGTIEAGVGEVGEALGLADPKTFGERKGEVIKRFADYEKETREGAPIASVVGDIAGYAAPAKGLGLLAKGAKGLMASKGLIQAGSQLPKAAQVAGQIAGVGAESAAIAGLQDQEGGAKERLHNAGQAFLTGAAFAGGAKGLGKAGEELMQAAKGMRIKGAGAMLKEFRQIFDKGQMDELSTYLKDKGLVGAGSTVASVAKKAKVLKEKAGKELSSLYKQAQEKLADPKLAGKLDPAQAFQKAGFSPRFQKDEILSFVKQGLGDEVGARNGIKQVSNYLDDLVSKYGDEIDIVSAREIKSAIDRSINYSRNPLSADPIKEQAFRQLRKYVNQRIDDQVKVLDKVLGGQGKEALKRLNKEYGNAATVLDMATDKFARENANRLFGLSEQIMTGAGGLGGAAYGIATTGDPTEALKYGLIGAGASRLGKKYGPGFGAPLMEVGGRALRGSGGLLRQAAPGVAPLMQREGQ